MTRRVLRCAVAIVLAYMVQAVILPHMKIGGLMIDIITVTLYTVGYAMGTFWGLMGGLWGALVMEVASGDLPGLTAALCIGLGAFGAWTAARIRAFAKPGMRRLEQAVKYFAPMVCVSVYEVVRELLYTSYFYLTGLDVGLRNITRALRSGLIVLVVSLLVLPGLCRMLLRSPDQTLVARTRRKWQARREAKLADMPLPKKTKKPKEAAPSGAIGEGGTDV